MTDVAIPDLPVLTPVPPTAVLPVDDGATTSKATALDVVKGGGALLKDGSVPATADLAMGTHRITGLQNGAAASQHAATVSQVETLIAAAIAGAGGGGGDGFVFTFSTSTTDADPGAGLLRINNATPGAGMTQIFVDLADVSGNDLTAWLDRLDDSIGTAKGYVRIGSRSDRTKWLLFKLSAVTSATGYRKLAVTYVAGPALPLTTASDTFLSFESLGFEGQVPLSSLTDGTACSVVTRSPNSTGAHADMAVGTNGFVVLRRSDAVTAALLLNENVDPAADIARSKLAGAVVQGTNLTDANQTINVSAGSEFTMVASTTTTARDKTLGTSGTPKTGEVLTFYVFAQGHNVVFKNGGPLANTLLTVTAGEKLKLSFEWDGANWLAPVVQRLA